MSIDRVNISSQSIDRAQATQQNEKTTRTAGPDRKVQTGTDSVALSSKAADMNRLTKTIEDSRSEHIDKVRQQLEAGTYRVSAYDLADKLIDTNRK